MIIYNTLATTECKTLCYYSRLFSLFSTTNVMPTTQADQQAKAGVLFALAAYTMWGFAPLYFKLLNAVSASEILVHRIVWSSILLVLIVLLSRKTKATVNIIRQPKLLAKLTATALLLGGNWFLFIWAVNNDHLLDASLGYYINPLLNVALGMLFLGERLRKWQAIAVALAVLGVLVQIVMLGRLPIIALALAGSFGIYGLLRKKLQLDSFVGLLVESILMLPLALSYWFWFTHSATSDMTSNSTNLNLTLIAAGIVTTAPLLCFTSAAKRLTLTTLGFFQYIGPSLMFGLAIVIYNEPLQPAKLITFGFIWLALALYSVDSYRARKSKTVKKATLS